MTMLPRRKKNPQTRMTAVRTVLEVPAPTILPVRILLAVPVVRTAVADKIRMPRTSPGPDRGQSASSQQPSAGSSTPQTGDAGEPALWGVVMLLSFAALAVTGVIAKRKEGQSKSDR